MSGAPALRASDADRDATIALLREHTAEGRLTLEEFTERMSVASVARTSDELAQLARDLPSLHRAGSRRSRTRFLLTVFASTVRDGRIRVARRIVGLTVFGSIGLDLRQATTEHDVITIFALGVFGAIDVYVPEGVEIDLHGFAVFGHKQEHGNDPAPYAGTPLVRIFALSVFAGIDAWRVPVAWSGKKRREVIRGIRKGEHKEIEA